MHHPTKFEGNLSSRLGGDRELYLDIQTHIQTSKHPNIVLLYDRLQIFHGLQRLEVRGAHIIEKPCEIRRILYMFNS